MSGPINPGKLFWTHGGKNTDGSDFDPERFHGWELELNGEAALSIPVGWNQGGEYEAPVASLELAEGDYSARLRLVTVTPEIASDWSGAVSFRIRKTPEAPRNFSVA